jgi:hypothetical protein
MHNSIQYHIKKKLHLVDPCIEGDCLVKASCTIFRKLPWERVKKCPEYNRYVKWEHTFNTIGGAIQAFFAIIIVLAILIFIIGTFCLGLWEDYKLVTSLF